jgi:hypothetical protein
VSCGKQYHFKFGGPGGFSDGCGTGGDSHRIGPHDRPQVAAVGLSQDETVPGGGGQIDSCKNEDAIQESRGVQVGHFVPTSRRGITQLQSLLATKRFKPACGRKIEKMILRQ